MKLIAILAVCGAAWSSASVAEEAATPQTLDVRVDAGRVTGTINTGLLGVNHGPLAVHESHIAYTGRNAVDLSDRYRELGIRSVRLDEFGAIDLQSLFPDFSADPEDPAAYTFELADRYLKAIVDVGAEIVFRIGYSEKPRRVDPPSDFDKWARVFVQVAKHYNDGWADGFHWNIRHWEVWNEPSGHGWTGTLLEYCRLYEAAVRAMKAYDPDLQIGGPALGSPDARRDVELGEIFVFYCAERDLPIDFFSYHLYFNKPQEHIEHAERHRRVLDAAGFRDTPLFLTEWGWLSGRAYPPPVEDLASIDDAAADVSALAVLHDRVDRAHFYVGGAMADYPWGLFDFVRTDDDVSVRPRKSFHAFRAYRILTEHPARVQVEAAPSLDEGGCAVLAGRSEESPAVAVLLSNYGTEVSRYRIAFEDLPWTGPVKAEIGMLDSARDLETLDGGIVGSDGTAAVEVDVETPSVLLVRLTPATELPTE